MRVRTRGERAIQSKIATVSTQIVRQKTRAKEEERTREYTQ